MRKYILQVHSTLFRRRSGNGREERYKRQIEEEKEKQEKLNEQINQINIAAFKQWDNDVMGVSSETMLKQKETQERSHSGDFLGL